MTIPAANQIYIETLTSPNWISLGEGNYVMNLGDGFAKLGKGGLYAERVISVGASDVANITGLGELDTGNDLFVSYSAKESKITFSTGKATYVLDGKKNQELYSATLNYLFEDALVGLEGGETTPFEKKSGHGTLYKAGVIALTVAIALGVSGCLDSSDNAKENPTDNYKPDAKATGTPAEVSDSHVKQRLTGGYDIVGPKEAPGVKSITPPKVPEKAILDDGVISTGNMDDISVIFSADGKTASIYANEAAFKNNGGNIEFHPMLKGAGSSVLNIVSIDEFELVAPGVYRYDIDIPALKAKYNLPSGTGVRVNSIDSAAEATRANERGGFAMAQFVID